MVLAKKGLCHARDVAPVFLALPYTQQSASLLVQAIARVWP